MADPSVAQTLALAIIGGGAVTAVAGGITRATEFRREDHARWVAERRDAYLSFFQHASEAIHAVSMVTISKEYSVEGDAAIDLKNEAADFIEAVSEWDVHVSSLRLLARGKSAAAVAQLVDAVEEWSMPMYLILQEHPAALDEVPEEIPAQALFDLEEKAIRAARRDLGMHDPLWRRLSRAVSQGM